MTSSRLTVESRKKKKNCKNQSGYAEKRKRTALKITCMKVNVLKKQKDEVKKQKDEVDVLKKQNDEVKKQKDEN